MLMIKYDTCKTESPTTGIVSLEEIKDYLRREAPSDGDAFIEIDDNVLNQLIFSVTDLIEKKLSRIIVERSKTLYFSNPDSVLYPAAILDGNVGDIVFTKNNDDDTTEDISDAFFVLSSDTDRFDCPEIHRDCDVSLSFIDTKPLKKMTITYTAGWVLAEIPAVFKEACCSIVGYIYENRIIAPNEQYLSDIYKNVIGQMLINHKFRWL